MTQLDKEYIEFCSSLFNRSREQSVHLFQILDNDIWKLVDYELFCKQNSIFRVPNNKKELKDSGYVYRIIFNSSK